jgi:putative endonuclease
VTRKRAEAERRGRAAERLAAFMLALKGYRILARRFCAAGGEIDIAARRRDVLVFAEVKARADVDDAIRAVGARTRRRIEAAGRAFIAARPRLAALGVRYDIIAVSGFSIRHLEGVWREGEY